MDDDSSDVPSYLSETQPSRSNAKSSTLPLLPEDVFHDQTPPIGSSDVHRSGIDFPAEYPWLDDIHMKTNIWGPPFFYNEFLQHRSPPSAIIQPNETPLATQIGSLDKIQPYRSNNTSNTFSLPENPSHDRTRPTGRSAVPHKGFDFPADEDSGRFRLPSLISALETQVRMIKFHSVQECEDIFPRSASFPHEFPHRLSIPPIGTRPSTYFLLNQQIDKVRSMAKSPDGSAELKQRILQNNPNIMSAMVYAVEDHIYELIFDQFGSSFLQTLFESMADEYIDRMLRKLLLGQQRLRDACMHNNGNMTVIKLIRRLKSPRHQRIFTNIMKKYAMALTKSTLGNEALCECFYILSRQHIKMLMTEVVKRCFVVATDKVGCCILQLCMQYCDEDTIRDLLNELGKYAMILSEHPYGNYVVQCVVELVNRGFISARILCNLEGHYVDLSMNKFASHVVEKCISEFPEDEANKIVREIMASPRFAAVSQNAFGNYVIQRALRRFTGSILQELIACIDGQSTYLRSHPHSRAVINAANARMAQLS